MRYTPIHSLLFTLVLGCQTKHQFELESPEEVAFEKTDDAKNGTESDSTSIELANQQDDLSKPTATATPSDMPETEPMPVEEVALEQTVSLKKERKTKVPQRQKMAAGEGMRAPAPSSASVSDSIGGLIGTKGVQVGYGGLGTSGNAVGGGGSTGNASYGKKMELVVLEDADAFEVDAVQVQQASGEEYTDYGINPFVQTSKDALSTFSIDVDTASYSIARRKINEGTLPNYASVRAEEYINYFDYEYDTASLSQANPFAIDMELMHHPMKEDREILRVGLQGMEYSVDSRPPLHLTFLVDVSGSMSSHDKLPLAKEAMHMLVDTLREDDTVALATYAGNISKVLAPTFGDNRKTIHAAIDRLHSGGSTAMSSGLDLAYEMAWQSFEPGAENRVIVLSDGDANVGRTGWTDMLSQIQSYADRGITMSTMGFGMGNYKDTRMEQLANNGDGSNYYIDSRAQAHRVFVEDFNSTMLNIARDVKIQVEFNPALIQSYRLIGYENRDIADKDFRNDRVDAGEIGSGHNVTALYEIVRTDEYARGSLVTTRLRYEKPGPDSVASEQSWTLANHTASRPTHATELAFVAGTFAEILRRSPYASSISMAELKDYAVDVMRRGNKDEQELLSLIQQAEALGASPSLVTR